MMSAPTENIKCMIGIHEYRQWKVKHFKKIGKRKIWDKCMYCGKVKKVN